MNDEIQNEVSVKDRLNERLSKFKLSPFGSARARSKIHSRHANAEASLLRARLLYESSRDNNERRIQLALAPRDA